jgi:hypothetical protein
MRESKHYFFVSLLFFSVFVFGASAARAFLIDSAGNVVINKGAVLSKQTEDADKPNKLKLVKSESEETEEKTEEAEEVKNEVEIEEQDNEEESEFQSTIQSKKKVNIINKNGTTRMLFEEESETPEGQMVIEEPEEEFELEIEESTKEAKIKVRTKNENYYIAKAKVAAKTNFPLSIDLDTNELIVTTPGGVKRVSILPDQAILNMLGDDIFDVVDQVKNDGDEEIENEIEMTTSEDGTLVYKIAGTKYKKFLGVFSVAVEKEVEVSAETGEVVDTDISLTNALLDAFSF